MATYRRVYDSRHMQADCQVPGSAPERYAQQSSMGDLYLFYIRVPNIADCYCDYWRDSQYTIVSK